MNKRIGLVCDSHTLKNVKVMSGADHKDSACDPMTGKKRKAGTKITDFKSANFDTFRYW